MYKWKGENTVKLVTRTKPTESAESAAPSVLHSNFQLIPHLSLPILVHCHHSHSRELFFLKRCLVFTNCSAANSRQLQTRWQP